MLPWLLLLVPIPALLAPTPALAGPGIPKTHGVAPNLLSRYTPSSKSTWKCLDGSKEIAWSAVNDDYCDCLDGSDEPGTGACPGTSFYCKNEGHIGTSIPATRVNDGLCEVECCDGSDEKSGVCPNLCKEIGDAYRQKLEEENKLRRKGSKIRSSYISFAKKEKKRLEESITSTLAEISVREKEVARLQDIVDRTESLSAAALEHKKQSPLYTSLLAHHEALTHLRSLHAASLAREAELGNILDGLRRGYNPNYQDMAVLEAVRGWEGVKGLKHIYDEGGLKDGEEGGEGEVKEGEVKVAEGEEERDEETMEKELDMLLDVDHVSLLLEHERHVNAPVEESILFDITSYLPDTLIPQYLTVKESIVSLLQKVGVVRGAVDGSSSDASRTRELLSAAQHSLKLTTEEKDKAEEDLKDLFDERWFGKEGEWKKLDKVCLEKDTGDYTYEVCLFEEARQKPNSGGQTFSLGKFHSWNEDAEPGTPAYYSKQHYRQGTKCWNGPNRSVVFLLTCGLENEILSVVELEKCEYQLTGTSPALCLPVGEGTTGVGTGGMKTAKEEL
ncbi:hypothetical protein JAAARDRAFT_28714 [Jaapia argillacea MUCL 33604]|uniref:Glucosidase 2 subunit beta n=1 Tax=Jaapia argillacea MUCL 33604 TaxID=933084 RepID=A0A067QDB2_9AGAM|nr:hypothetical protein JAAARDRAFT_28714 [Jaapia argillacea MUCL 33604]